MSHLGDSVAGMNTNAPANPSVGARSPAELLLASIGLAATEVYAGPGQGCPLCTGEVERPRAA
jgi:hypothetical protein